MEELVRYKSLRIRPVHCLTIEWCPRESKVGDDASRALSGVMEDPWVVDNEDCTKVV